MPLPEHPPWLFLEVWENFPFLTKEDPAEVEMLEKAQNIFSYGNRKLNFSRRSGEKVKLHNLEGL